MTTPNQTQDQTQARKLSLVEQLFCAWPIALVAVGGAIGGACGGAAWALNMKIMSSERPAWMRYALCVATGIGAIVVYFLAIAALAIAFPNIFAR